MIIDTEHGNIADDEMHISVGVIASQGVSPMVRIPAPENWIVKRTLDTGGKWTIPRDRVLIQDYLRSTCDTLSDDVQSCERWHIPGNEYVR